MYHYSNMYLYLPSLKWKSKTEKLLWSFCLSPVFLQDSVPVFFMATFLRRVTWNKLYPFPHILFFLNSPATWSFTPANASQLKLFLLSLASMLQHLTKMCMCSYLWDFVVFAQLNTPFLLLTLMILKLPWIFSWVIVCFFYISFIFFFSI